MASAHKPRLRGCLIVAALPLIGFALLWSLPGVREIVRQELAAPAPSIKVRWPEGEELVQTIEEFKARTGHLPSDLTEVPGPPGGWRYRTDGAVYWLEAPVGKQVLRGGCYPCLSYDSATGEWYYNS